MKQHNLLWWSCAAFVCAFAACSKDSTPQMQRIGLAASTTLGDHIVDNDNRTLYFFSNDVTGASNCAGNCLVNWQPFLLDSTVALYEDGLSATDFTTTTNTAGQKQTAYKGWPLYYYTPGGTAEPAGETSGEGVGGIWFVAKPGYSIMIANYQLTGANGINYLSDYTVGDGRTVYFTDGVGNTLYSFGRDSAMLNKFTAADFSNNAVWPIYETDNITVPSTLVKSDFQVITTYGKKQLTYKGWPLYYYGADGMIRGINKGITIPPSQPVGAIWPVVNQTVMAAPQ